MSPERQLKRDRQKRDDALIKASEQASLIALIAVIYDTTDCFVTENIESPTDEISKELEQVLRPLSIGSETKKKITNLVDEILNRTRFTASQLIDNYGKMLTPMEYGDDNWKKINKAIDENLGIQIVKR